MGLKDHDKEDIKAIFNEVLDEHERRAAGKQKKGNREKAERIARHATVFASYIGLGVAVFSAALTLAFSSDLAIKWIGIAMCVLSMVYIVYGLKRVSDLHHAESS